MSITVFSGPNRTGTARVLGPGRYTNIGFRSTLIPAGWELGVGDDLGGGKINLRMGPYDTSGSDISRLLWGALNCSNFGLVDVVKVGDAPTGLLLNESGVHWHVPQGTTVGGSSWRNDATSRIVVPVGCTARVWEHQNCTGANQTFHGQPGGQPQNMEGLWNKVSAIQLSQDKLEAVGAPVLDWDHAQDLGTSESVGAHSVLDNSANSSDATLSSEIGVEASSTAETHWDLSAGGSLTSSTTIGTGEASPVKVEQQVSVEVRFDASKGGSNSSTNSKRISQSVSAPCPAHGRKGVELVVKRSRQKVPCSQKLRNTVTGAETWVRGETVLDMVVDTTARVVDN